MRWGILALVALGSVSGFVVGVKVAQQPAPLPSSSSTFSSASTSALLAPAGSAGPMLVVPRAATPIKIDGEPEDPAWTANELLRTPAYSERPYSDARFTMRDGNLYVLLYAADEDLHAAQASHDGPLWSADAMRVILAPRKDGREYVVEVSPAGTLTDYTRTGAGANDASWESGAKVGVDLDGVLDQPGSDEEWVAELSIPLESLGPLDPPSTLGLRVERTDVSNGASSGLLSWTPPGGRVILSH